MPLALVRPDASMRPLLLMPPVTTPLMLMRLRVTGFGPSVGRCVKREMIVPLFWIWPLSVPVTATACVELAAPPVVVLLIVPGRLFVTLPVPEMRMQSLTELLLAGATTAMQPAAAAPELRLTIIARSEERRVGKE